MKSVGADIRVVNISKVETGDLIRKFINSNNLKVEKDEESNKKTTNIQAYNPIDSVVKFWWKGIPQVIGWKIIELKNEQTKIEIRFGHHKKYTIWFWGVLIALTVLFSIFYAIGEKLPLAKNPGELVRVTDALASSSIVAGIILIMILIFTAKSVILDYSQFIDSFKNAIGKRKESFSQRIIKNDQCPPHIFLVLAFFLGAATIFFISHGLSIPDNIRPPILIPTLSILGILFILLAILLLSIKIKHFSRRMMFALIGVMMTLSVLIYCTIPFMTAYTGNLAKLYDVHLHVESLLKKEPDSHNLERSVAASRIALNNFFSFVVCFNVFIIAISGVIFVGSPRVARGVIKWKHDIFSEKTWVVSHKPAIDFSSYAKSFSFTIFILWFVISVALYLYIYTILCIAEFCVVGKNFIFETYVGKTFFTEASAIITFFLAPHVLKSNVELFARLILFSYTLPILLIILMVIKKRMKSYTKSLQEMRRYKLKNNRHNSRILDICSEIAENFGVRMPDILLIPHKSPIIAADYIGAPYFRSYILVSDACIKMKDSELEGLLAHEIYHVKRHTSKWYILKLLSDYTLFGTGFLAVTTNSYVQELEADYHAARWAAKKGSVQDYINALQALAWSGSIKNGQGLGIAGGESEKFEEEHKKRSFFKKNKRKLDAVLELYFGDEILSYIHPPLAERIERIKAVAQSQDEM